MADASGHGVEWIGVADVAAEMSYTERQAWECIRKLGVPMIGHDRKTARFRREDFERLRLEALKPAPPRAKYRRSGSLAKPSASALTQPAIDAAYLAQREASRKSFR